MCVSTDPAEFTGTTLYVGRRAHPEHGLIHVLGYQNTAVNLATGPNAMLLHLPALALAPENLVPVGRDADFLDRITTATRPAAVDDLAVMGDDEAVAVFEHDVYTVVLAADATRLPSALHRVEPRKRPRLDEDLLAFYTARYPDHAIVLCCFDNAEAQRAKPLLLWYEPWEPDLLVAPALDCHTGSPPDLSAPVAVDHHVAFGTDAAPAGWGSPVTYSPAMRRKVRQFLPDAVLGRRFDGHLPNGDFAIGHDDLLAGDLGQIERVS